MTRGLLQNIQQARVSNLTSKSTQRSGSRCRQPHRRLPWCLEFEDADHIIRWQNITKIEM